MYGWLESVGLVITLHPRANWSIRPPPDAAHHLPAGQPSFGHRLVNRPLLTIRPAPARHRRPLHPPRPPSQLAHPPPPGRRSPNGKPLWHHRTARGLPGVGYPLGARPSTPRAGRRSAPQAPRHRHAAGEPLPRTLFVHASLPRFPQRTHPPCESVELLARSV